jgi:hypothetical protein
MENVEPTRTPKQSKIWWIRKIDWSKNTQKHEKPRKLFNRFRIIFHSIFDPTKIYSSLFANNFPCLFLIRENYDWALPKINPPQNISAQFSSFFLFPCFFLWWKMFRKILKLSFLKCLFLRSFWSLVFVCFKNLWENLVRLKMLQGSCQNWIFRKKNSCFW